MRSKQYFDHLLFSAIIIDYNSTKQFEQNGEEIEQSQLNAHACIKPYKLYVRMFSKLSEEKWAEINAHYLNEQDESDEADEDIMDELPDNE